MNCNCDINDLMNQGCQCGSLDKAKQSDPSHLKEFDVSKANNTCDCDLTTLMNQGCQCKHKLSLPKINLLGSTLGIGGVILSFEVDPSDAWNSMIKVEMLFGRDQNKKYYYGTILSANKGKNSLTVSNNAVKFIPEKNVTYELVWNMSKDGVKIGDPTYMRLKLSVA